MTPLQELEVRAADIRRRFGEIGGMGGDAITDEITAELATLRAEHASNELRQSALKLAGDGNAPAPIETATPDAKLNELRERVGFGPYVAAAMAGRPVLVGAEHEYNAERGIAEGWFPMELIARSAEGPVEVRHSINGDAQGNQATWLDRVFHDSAAARVGISFRSVAPGVAAHPVMQSGGSGVQRGRTESVADSTFTVAVTEIKPSRHAVRGIYSIEDDYRLPGLSDSIERDLRAAIVESVDLACFKGDHGANENVGDITGLQTAAIVEATITQANKVKADETLKVFVTQIDGKYAASLADLMIVTSVGTNALWHSTIHNSAVDNETMAQFMMRSGLAWSAKGQIDTATSNGDFGAYLGLARGIDGAGIAAVWESGQLVRDPYSGADNGEVALTLNYLWNLAFPRVHNFKRLKFVS